MTVKADWMPGLVRLLTQFDLLLLARCQLASSYRMGMRRCPSLPRLLINCIDRECLTRSNSRILPLLAA